MGVAWNLAGALRRRLRASGWFGGERPEPDVRRQLDLVALGTVADVVPLRNVNRVLVSAGPTREAVDPVRFLSAAISCHSSSAGTSPGSQCTLSPAIPYRRSRY